MENHQRIRSSDRFSAFPRERERTVRTRTVLMPLAPRRGSWTRFGSNNGVNPWDFYGFEWDDMGMTKRDSTDDIP